MGLGSLREVSLAEAIEAALDARKLIRAGVDPIEDRREHRQQTLAGQRRSVTFAAAVRQYLVAQAPGWKNAKHRQQWCNTLQAYVEPIMGALTVDRIDTAHVIKVLEPIWTTKTKTATRVRQRIESVLDYCTTRGFRSGPNPARWKGHLENLLPAPNKVAKVVGHAAVPWRDMPTFMQRLRNADGTGARALEFVVLTAARSGEVRGATWNEVNLDEALWTVPAERMKVGKLHVVPLSAAAIKLLHTLPRFANVPYLFPSTRGTPLSDMRLRDVLKRLQVAATAHGMRSSFKDWASESTAYPNEVTEMALAHAIRSATELAYRRGNLLAKRTRLMRDWAAYLLTPKPTQASVTPIQKRRAK